MELDATGCVMAPGMDDFKRRLDGFMMVVSINGC